MSTNMVLISKSVLTSTASLIAFSSIPNTYDDLLLLMSLKSPSTSGDGIYTADIILKNGSGAAFSAPTFRALRGSGSSASSYTTTNTTYVGGPIPGGFNTANTFNNTEIYFPNYGSSTNKSASLSSVAESNDNSYASITLGALSWPTSSAIAAIEISIPYTHYVVGSSFFLYGINNA